MCFQMTFAIITPALICGSFADRMKFSAMLWFIGLWATFVYAPIAHWVWGPDGFLSSGNDKAMVHVLDFAGGTVVHINSGVAGLMCALMLGKRKGLGHENMAPHNLVLTMIGASLLWVGWFGFNAGSATSAGLQAGMAMTVTQIATASAALSWMFVEWIFKGKPSVLGICSGAVAGLVAITPASGFVGPAGSLVIGFVAGAVCYWGAVWLKGKIGYDDALDAFGVHAVGGFAGAMLTGVFAINEYGGTPGLIEGNAVQVWYQLEGIVCVIVYDVIMTPHSAQARRHLHRAARARGGRGRGSRHQPSWRGGAVRRETGARGRHASDRLARAKAQGAWRKRPGPGRTGPLLCEGESEGGRACPIRLFARETRRRGLYARLATAPAPGGLP